MEEIIKAISYDAETGGFTWKEPRRRGMKPGCKAGTLTAKGYVQIAVNGKQYLAHRLAWLLAYGRWPSSTIDHINGIGIDNRLENLREATPSQNSMNRCVAPNNTSGVTGVSLVARTGRWEASITVDRHTKRFGSYRSFDEAVQARRQAEREFFGEFSRLATAQEKMVKKISLQKDKV